MSTQHFRMSHMENLSQELLLVPKGDDYGPRRRDMLQCYKHRHLSLLKQHSNIIALNKPQIPSHNEQHKTNFTPLVIKKIIRRLRLES